MTDLHDARLIIAVYCAAAASACGSEAECGDCFEQGYRIDLSALPLGTDPPPAVLFSGWRNGWCQQDHVCTGTPDAFLGTIATELGWEATCQKKELVVFAGGHEPKTAQVTSDAGQSINLDPAKVVDVTIWLVDGHPDTPELAQKDAARARNTFSRFGTGIELNFDIKPFPTHHLELMPLFPIQASCDISAPTLPGLTGGGYDSGRLNVYYVTSIVFLYDGLTCYGPPAFLPDIILVKADLVSSPQALPHELGHALGLQRSITLPEGDIRPHQHTNELALYPYLKNENLMRAGGSFVGQITLGQIYRMHYDKVSWLWRSGTSSNGYPRDCQHNPVEGGPCPPLTLHPPGGWP